MSRLCFRGEFKITCKYLQKGNLWKSGFHQGIDLVGMTNKKLYSICYGIVTTTGYDKGRLWQLCMCKRRWLRS